MIRRDYFMRMVQEITQALTRIVFLRKAQDFPQALQEIERVLSKFWNLAPEQIKSLSLEEWIDLCRREEGPMGEKLIALADLLKEQDELCQAEAEAPGSAPPSKMKAESRRSAAIALGLYLEAVSSADTIISVDLLSKIEQLIERTQGFRVPPEVLKRLLGYYEARGMLDKAEDALFDWLDTGDPNAPEGGLAFYERLSQKSDQELERSRLPRAEIEEGRAELMSRFSNQ